jgi:DMSO/TMAO reductase YedYZ molybdopterin-dependent catalytic subunit
MTGTPQRIDLASYRLKVGGKVERPLSLSFDELRRLPRLASKPALICRGYFEDYANWAGASIGALLDRAGAEPSARELDLVSADGYSTSVSMAEARSPDAYLAYELEGGPLPVLHGFPLRAVFPGLLGNKWAKWIVEIQVR